MDQLVLAKSLAGHDKNHYYVICQESEDLVFLANGTTKKLLNPKKKKKIHIQVIKKLPDEILEEAKKYPLDDDGVAHILNLYRNRKEKENV